MVQVRVFEGSILILISIVGLVFDVDGEEIPLHSTKHIHTRAPNKAPLSIYQDNEILKASSVRMQSACLLSAPCLLSVCVTYQVLCGAEQVVPTEDKVRLSEVLVVPLQAHNR